MLAPVSNGSAFSTALPAFPAISCDSLVLALRSKFIICLCVLFNTFFCLTEPRQPAGWCIASLCPAVLSDLQVLGRMACSQTVPPHHLLFQPGAMSLFRAVFVQDLPQDRNCGHLLITIATPPLSFLWESVFLGHEMSAFYTKFQVLIRPVQ